ncbi:MAG TPA: hypothetical protein VH062_14070 [Polyangiaceae bacterium]|jgi:hypothetical protein|nr:hypothetical protein [Polyangiaceae bacterium]
MSMIQMTSAHFAPANPSTLVNVTGDGASALVLVTVNKHSSPVPNGTIASDQTSADVYMETTDFAALVSCLKDGTTKAVLTLTYSGTTVTATSISCVLKAA